MSPGRRSISSTGPDAASPGGSSPLRRARRRPAPRAVRDFYAAALQEAEQAALEQAQDVEGLDSEIAVLRVKLRELLSPENQDPALFMRTIELLVRAVSARYRMSGKAQDDLYQSVVGVLEGVGKVLVPEESDAR